MVTLLRNTEETACVHRHIYGGSENECWWSNAVHIFEFFIHRKGVIYF